MGSKKSACSFNRVPTFDSIEGTHHVTRFYRGPNIWLYRKHFEFRVIEGWELTLEWMVRCEVLAHVCARFSKLNFNLHMSPHFSIESKPATCVQHFLKNDFNLHMIPHFSIKPRPTSWANVAQHASKIKNQPSYVPTVLCRIKTNLG